MTKEVKKKVELLSPAGSLSKLKVAFHFGADAAYIGGKEFSLRAYANNFSRDEILEAVEYAHALGKKIYVTANIFPKNEDFPALIEYLKFLESAKVDAVLLTDSGLIYMAKKVAPNLEIHLSTQANNLNKYTVEFWGKQGVTRVVLARELSLEQIKEIKEHNPTIELEIFVHGAMCISYSGRCLLSNYLSTRDSNRGECVQACRWKFKINEETFKDRKMTLESKKEQDALEIEEDDRGTYILNSKDLNLIEYLDKLMPYVESFKIEGRMKSEYYVASVVNTYRKCIDELYDKGHIENMEEYLNDLDKIMHRHYTNAYILGENDETVEYSGKQKGDEYIFVGMIMEKLSKHKYIVEMRNRFAVSEELEILSSGKDHNKTFMVQAMLDESGEIVLDAKLVQQRLIIDIPYDLEPGDILRKKNK